MKKRMLILIATLFFTCTLVFAQTNSTVKLSDDVYELLDIAEARGLCPRLKNQKPYTRKYIIETLNIISDNIEKDKSKYSETELEIVKTYIDRFSPAKSSLPELRFVTSNNSDNLPMKFSIYYAIEGLMSGGIYQNKSQNSFGFEEWNTLGFNGDFGNNVSFDWDGGISFMQMPLTRINKEDNEYYIGSWWDHTVGHERRDPEKYPEESKFSHRYINTFKNYSTLPYHYVKHWDGSIYNIDDFNAGGLKGWPNNFSFGLTMLGGIEASFFNNRLYLGISRKNREWGAMDFGAGLALNANARPFLGLEASFQLFDWLSFAAMTGFLEFPNQDHINGNAWYVVNDETGESTHVVPSGGKDSYFFQDMFAINIMNFDFKYFHFDFGSTVIFPKRFELGYMFPIFEKVIYQNNIGDFDNLGLFGSFMGRYPGLGSIWLSLFFDEINAPNIKTMFNDSRCMFAFQTGLKTVFPLIPFGKLSFRYTKIEPYTYTHTAVKMPYYSNYIASTYMNNGAPLGYYLEPNSDEFIVRIEGKPVKNLDVGFQYQLVRHGTTWGPHSVEGSSIYSELEPYNRDAHHKYFLKDGAYEWTNMVILDASYDLRSHGLPMQFSASIGYIYDFFTKSGSYNAPANMVLIEKSDPLYSHYPVTTGAVLSMGFKFFAF